MGGPPVGGMAIGHPPAPAPPAAPARGRLSPLPPPFEIIPSSTPRRSAISLCVGPRGGAEGRRGRHAAC